MASSGNKINPFELDPYDEWDDGGWGDDQAEGYAAEDQRLMDEYYSGSGRNKASLPYQSYDRQSQGKRTFQAQGFGNESYHHSPQLWKYILLGVVLLMVLLFRSDKSNKRSGEDYMSLIDEIPKDEYRLVILGERHSGTSWLHDRLQECYPQTEVSTTLQRPGYFFQQEPSKQEQAKQHPQDTIVLHLTLNIYDWLEQMRSSPEYAPNHVGVHEEGHIVPLPWHDFLLRPWAIDRPDRDSIFRNETGPVCQLGFHFNQVVSCVETPIGGTDNPIYELNMEKGGKPYESIIEMRAAKLQNHQGVQKWKNVKNFITVPYESAGKEFKSRILDEIEKFAGWKPACSGNVLPPTRAHTATMTKEFVQFVTTVTDWEAEALVSYEPWSEADVEAKGIKEETIATGAPKETAAPTNKPDTKAPKATGSHVTTVPASTTAPAEEKPTEDTDGSTEDATSTSNTGNAENPSINTTTSNNSTDISNDAQATNSTSFEAADKPSVETSSTSNVMTNATTSGGNRWRLR